MQEWVIHEKEECSKRFETTLDQDNCSYTWLAEVFKNPKITEFACDCDRTRYDHEVIEILANNKTLDVIVLWNMRTYDTSCWILRRNTYAKSFVLYFRSINDYFAKYLSKALRKQKTIRHLQCDFQEINLTKKGVQRLREGFDANKSLVSATGFEDVLDVTPYVERNRGILGACQAAVRYVIWAGRQTLLGPDVAKLIARMLWETRGDLSWDLEKETPFPNPKRRKGNFS